MPGILPMRVLKVGNSGEHPEAIFEACDRCKTKKIRCCDTRPCDPCTNAGIECITTHKAKNFIFARGYTERLEDRVRVLEAEIRDWKHPIHGKDLSLLGKEKINERLENLQQSSSTYSDRISPLQNTMFPSKGSDTQHPETNQILTTTQFEIKEDQDGLNAKVSGKSIDMEQLGH